MQDILADILFFILIVIYLHRGPIERVFVIDTTRSVGLRMQIANLLGCAIADTYRRDIFMHR